MRLKDTKALRLRLAQKRKDETSFRGSKKARLFVPKHGPVEVPSKFDKPKVIDSSSMDVSNPLEALINPPEPIVCLYAPSLAIGKLGSRIECEAEGSSRQVDYH